MAGIQQAASGAQARMAGASLGRAYVIDPVWTWLLAGRHADVERQHPTDPHWYLEALAVVTEARGRGVGPALLTPVLDRCDAERMPAYLESTDLRNVPFFERQGFIARSPLATPAGCPVVTPMWREPR